MLLALPALAVLATSALGRIVSPAVAYCRTECPIVTRIGNITLSWRSYQQDTIHCYYAHLHPVNGQLNMCVYEKLDELAPRNATLALPRSALLGASPNMDICMDTAPCYEFSTDAADS